MVSKTKISKRLSRKRNPELRNIVITLEKQGRLDIAALLSMPRRKKIAVNLERLNRETKAGDAVIVPGRVLGKGSLDHKIDIAAFSFSQKAREKLDRCKIIAIEDASRNKDFKIFC